MQDTVCRVAPPDSALTTQDVAEVVAQACRRASYAGKRVLLIVPDGTRTASIGPVFQQLHAQIGKDAKAFDVLIALGTHQAMSEQAICGRLEISIEQRTSLYSAVRFFNHAWDNPAQLRRIGTLEK